MGRLLQTRQNQSASERHHPGQLRSQRQIQKPTAPNQLYRQRPHVVAEKNRIAIRQPAHYHPAGHRQPTAPTALYQHARRKFQPDRFRQLARQLQRHIRPPTRCLELKIPNPSRAKTQTRSRRRPAKTQPHPLLGRLSSRFRRPLPEISQPRQHPRYRSQHQGQQYPNAWLPIGQRRNPADRQ